MAEGFDPSKTEAPTQHRREEAREQGQVASSSELASSLVLLAGMAGLVFAAGHMGGGLLESVRNDLLGAGQPLEIGPEQVKGILSRMLLDGLELAGFVMALVFVTAVAAGSFQVGFRLTPHLLAINWERVSWVRGWSRLMSAGSAVRGLVMCGKLVLVTLVAYWLLKTRLTQIAGLQQMTLPAIVSVGWKAVMHLALAVAGMLGLIGVIDYVWQRWRHEQSLRMSRQEVKEEAKREEGDPLVKARVRKLQREAAAKRMFKDVPRATVVVTNPTHLAVAIRYERGEMAAPKVVAKGAGFVAARIVALARKHGVPVLERKPVAQALFKAVKVGQEIPITLYHLVAEVLAYLYRLRAG